jgi:hypothetical protein
MRTPRSCRETQSVAGTYLLSIEGQSNIRRWAAGGSSRMSLLYDSRARTSFFDRLGAEMSGIIYPERAISLIFFATRPGLATRLTVAAAGLVCAGLLGAALSRMVR